MKKYGNFLRTSKYRNVKVDRDGYTFDSKLEAAVYDILKLREKTGEIKILQCQDVVYLTKARIRYEPDFKCLDVESNTEWWCEAKGYIGERWPTIKKLWKHYGPGKLEIWAGGYMAPKQLEVIIPESSPDTSA